MKGMRPPRRRPPSAPAWLLLLCVAAATAAPTAPTGPGPATLTRDHTPGSALPSLDEVLASKQDLWGLAAMREPGGPAYDFFADLLPPLRYVNADFHYYPIVLSAPGAAQKARLVSNGSALNARANSDAWHEFGLPVTFYVGSTREQFGADFSRMQGPHFLDGSRPVVELSYQYDGTIYHQESFASVTPHFAEHGIVFIRFSVEDGRAGRVAAQLGGAAALAASEGRIRDTNGNSLAWFDDHWQWDAGARALSANLRHGQSATLAIPTRPVPGSLALALSHRSFPQELQRCLRRWETVLQGGATIEVPEPRVNDAWRALLVGLFSLTDGPRLNYSAGNAYARQFEAESGDAVGALLLYGFQRDAARLLPPLLDYSQAGLGFHDAAFKLQLLMQFFWLTHDTNVIAASRPRWEPALRRILDSREPGSGLFPRENYCGDIETQVYSLNSNGNSWRALRDMTAVTAALGQPDQADHLAREAHTFRQAILTAVDKSERRDVQPTFIPLALLGEESPYDRLTDSKIGSYWDLMAPYILGSGVFGPGSPRERAIVDYLQEHGGVCMGMIRFHQHSGLFANEDGLDDLYGLRYNLTLLRLDEVDRALVSFYGLLVQGLTRDTCLGAEGTGLRPLDPAGRPMYLPPNCTAQASFLWTLRYLLIQDWDLDDDGIPETLRLGFATPRAWLEDGKAIKVEHAPTAFGPVSFAIKSSLSRGKVVVELEPPRRNPPQHQFLRVRLPGGWRISGAQAGGVPLPVDNRGTLDVSFLRHKATVVVRVQHDQ